MSLYTASHDPAHFPQVLPCSDVLETCLRAEQIPASLELVRRDEAWNAIDCVLSSIERN